MRHRAGWPVAILSCWPVTVRCGRRKICSLTSNTLYRKAVQAAAVHPMHIDRISRHYAKRIEESVFCKGIGRIIA